MQTHTHDELLTIRAAHMENLHMLRRVSSSWPEGIAARGERTMCNLMQQVYDIDERLAQIIIDRRSATP